MIVILLTSSAGSDFSYDVCQPLDCEDSHAKRLIEAGIARETIEGELTPLQQNRLCNFGKNPGVHEAASPKKKSKAE